MSNSSLADLEVEQEINPLYEEEIEFQPYECVEEMTNKKLEKDLIEIKQMFAEILENEIIIQRDISLIKQQRLKPSNNSALPVEIINKNPNQFFSSANREFDLSKMNLPCSSLDDIRVLENQLNENLFFEIFFKNLLLEIECYDLTSFIKSAMQSVVNDDVTINFSWQGIGENIEIRTLKFMQILIEICGIKFNQTAKALIVRGIQKYLSLTKEKIRRTNRDDDTEAFWNDV